MGDAKSKLYDAVERENLTDIQKVLAVKPELLDESFDSKSTMNALLRSVWRGNLEIVRWLLDHGADINKRGRLVSYSVNDGNSALIWAAVRARKLILEELLYRGADITVTDSVGFTALDHAIINGNYEEAYILKKAVL
jgi:uncharacterized protein